VIISEAMYEMVRVHFETAEVKLPYTGLGIDQEEFEAMMENEIQGQKCVIGTIGSGVGSKVNTLVTRSKIE
jgi:hypothetical protein